MEQPLKNSKIAAADKNRMDKKVFINMTSNPIGFRLEIRHSENTQARQTATNIDSNYTRILYIRHGFPCFQPKNIRQFKH